MTEPVITLKLFFERVRDGALTAVKCGVCGGLAIPPKEFCEACGQRAWDPVPLAGDGTIASYTIIRVAPAKYVGDTPYAVAVVTLREGVSLLGRIVDVPLERLAVGLPVKFRPLAIHGHTTVGFGPA